MKVIAYQAIEMILKPKVREVCASMCVACERVSWLWGPTPGDWNVRLPLRSREQ